jgi:hypothetical protein
VKWLRQIPLRLAWVSQVPVSGCTAFRSWAAHFQDWGRETGIVANSPSGEKVALFRSLFAGRSDVYAMRWENAKSGRSGNAPACSNEWISGICNKPQIKCSECLQK